MNVNKLKISVRMIDALQKEGVKTVKQLTRLSPLEILKIPNVGKKSLAELMVALAWHDYCLSCEHCKRKDEEIKKLKKELRK
jgi:DNA-directed RNA polymerase alpha subunit